MKIVNTDKGSLFRARKHASFDLLDRGFEGLARRAFCIQGGAYQSGNGFQLLFSGGTNAGAINAGGTVVDPVSIDLGESGVWSGDKITLGGVTPLFGSQDKIQMIKVKIPGAMAANFMSISGNVPGLVTLINPAGSVATASANVVTITGPNYQPNSTTGNEKEIGIKLAVANAVLNGI